MMTRNEMTLEKLNDDVETAEKFCYLGNALNARGGSKMTIMAKIRIGWMRFRKCKEVLHKRRFLLKIKKKVYEICIRSTVFYGSEACSLREREVKL